MQVQIQHRIIGAEKPPSIALELLHEQLTVGELITRTVEEHVRDLLLNRKMDAEQARRILNRQYLTEEEVQRQATQGAVRTPSEKSVRIPKIDAEAEAEKALRAFEQGTYVVVVDGYQPEHLNETLTLKPTSKVTFLRMTPLVGG